MSSPVDQDAVEALREAERLIRGFVYDEVDQDELTVDATAWLAGHRVDQDGLREVLLLALDDVPGWEERAETVLAAAGRVQQPGLHLTDAEAEALYIAKFLPEREIPNQAAYGRAASKLRSHARRLSGSGDQ